MTNQPEIAPESELFSGNIHRPVYTLRQILVATFFGGPLAATFMMSQNFKNFDQPDLARKSWLVGIATMILYLFFALTLARKYQVLNYAVSIALVYAAKAAVNKWQSSMIDEHVAQAGLVRSGWNCFGVILVSVILFVLLVVPYLLYMRGDELIGV